MKSGKLITGIAVGAVIALILNPKSRKLVSDAVSNITDSLKDNMGNLAQTGMNKVNNLSDKTKDIAGGVKATKEVWQS